MLVLKYLLIILGIGLFGSASALVVYDIYLSAQLRRLLRRNTTDESGANLAAADHPSFVSCRGAAGDEESAFFLVFGPKQIPRGVFPAATAGQGLR